MSKKDQNNLDVTIPCGACGDTCVLGYEETSIIYKGKSFKIDMPFYVCRKCDNQFTTTASDEVWTSIIFNHENNSKV